ncbi:uncharacterized protein LOC106061303 [Biomphalaria glabrata]|uniref:Uncharacterized protein LOC106061303 n=1 Tax=Biomphalaria glabrata TaxID=6526 RepID=A0A9W2YTL0_BIOGL|nr:uncharacterized protein LOC106061303 [Biomphalaria glabrata]XP_055866065.1 uncharacterized protein LOC106061303 [Biomphalaria glabrata]XP_055866072.1 uncharacterized protein LOC106061303 [Biomphalaria glabrata]XP_055866080.1 uncharacterized protein LOC106061303 [Biomphalaria glabrata]
MGNKCFNRKKKDVPDANQALVLIREAQKKYYSSHIEEQDDSDNEREESTDINFGSQDSLDMLDTEPALPARCSIDLSSIQSSMDSLDVSGINNNKEGDGVHILDGTPESTASLRGRSRNAKKRAKAKFIRLSKRANFFSIFNEEDKKARNVDPKMYSYPFENIVFEGGGNKGLAYCGAVQLLEELGIWPQIKRLAGTSAGAMTAALLAIGYNSQDLKDFFSLNLNNIFLDHKCGFLSLVPNLLRFYGWNPGNRIYRWFGERIYEKTGNVDTTFKQVYEMFGRELCIVVTNLNQMTSLYCHPKTTPDMPIRLAVRMSLSIPGLFRAVKHTLYGHTDIFVDGGVLCNYPIHCFDGWWLSMEPEDNFLERLQPLEDIPRLLERTERFGIYNEKTLGMQLYSDNEQDLLKYQLENLRHGVELQDLPNTKLARAKIRKKKLQLKTDREHRRLVHAMNAFLRSLRRHNTDRNDTISRSELLAALQDENLFPLSKRLVLFGDVDSEIILEYLDKDSNGQISYNELLSFMEETGINMQYRFLGYQRRNIRSLPSFLETLQATLLTNVKRVYVEEKDLKRTVGINTGHVGTTDFVLEPEDIKFVIERGRRSLEAFLKYYVASYHLKKKPEYKNLQDLRKNSKGSLISSSSNQSLGSSDAVALEVALPLVPSLSLTDQMSESENAESTAASPVKMKSTKTVTYSENVVLINDTPESSENTDADLSETTQLLGDKCKLGSSHTTEHKYVKHREPFTSTSPTARQIELSQSKHHGQAEIKAEVHNH